MEDLKKALQEAGLKADFGQNLISYVLYAQKVAYFSADQGVGQLTKTRSRLKRVIKWESR